MEADGAELLNDYLWDEVLAAEDPDVLEVLLATSVAERIHTGLARRLTGREDAAVLLETARSRGLLVTRLATDTYRVHDLVRAALLREVERRAPDRTNELHAEAAAWCQDEGELVLAIEHWLAAGRTRDALRQLAMSSGPLYDAGRDETIRRVIKRLPPAVAADDVDALVELTWCHLLVDRHRFRELTDELGRLVDPPAHLVPRIVLLRSMTALSRGDFALGASLAEEALGHWGTAWVADPLGRFGWNMIGREIALSERWDDRSPEAVRTLRALSLDPDRQIAFEPSRAVGHALAGRPAEVRRISAEVRAALDLRRQPFQRVELEIAEAWARREAGERAAATRDLLEIVAGEPGLISFTHLLAWLMLAETRVEEGDLDRAELMFGEAAALVAGELTGRDTRSLLARTGVVVALARGRAEEAAGWAAQVADGFWGPVSSYRATGDPAHLATAVPRCPRHEVVLALQRFRATEDPAQLVAALDVAVPLGLVQTVASEGPLVTSAVEAVGWQLPRPWLVALRAAASRPAPNAGLESEEPLTDRELDVLRFLPTTMTLREIADHLFITQNTVKTHVKAIYRKLGCTTRAEAADRLRTAKPAGRTPGPG